MTKEWGRGTQGRNRDDLVVRSLEQAEYIHNAEHGTGNIVENSCNRQWPMYERELVWIDGRNISAKCDFIRESGNCSKKRSRFANFLFFKI